MTSVVYSSDRPVATESRISSVSWAAVIAGAVVATATSFALMILGSALGLSVLSPWSQASAVATTFAVSTAIWLVVMQWVSSALGGYIAGRLRTRWTDVHTDEVFFRDTAHGFLTWSLSTLIVACIAIGAATGTASRAVEATATVAGGAAAGTAGMAQGQTDYFIDMMFRPTTGGTAQASANEARGEVARILADGLTDGRLTPADRTYVAQVISARTGLAQADAERRVDEVLVQLAAAKAKIKDQADNARKAGIVMAFVTFISLLIGAFIASVSAALGGRLRDD
ncbi:MAG: hypothetical protein ACT7A5_24535 [Ferrovibrionaceae bacterium]